jgi:hypothetical protein
MREVYEGASRVVVWLGPQQADSDQGMDSVREASDPRNQTWKHLGPEAGLAVEMILTRPYLSRAWVQQEIIVPSAQPLIMCGGKTILWDDFALGFGQIWQSEASEPRAYHQINQTAVAGSRFMEPFTYRSIALGFRSRSAFAHGLFPQESVNTQDQCLLHSRRFEVDPVDRRQGSCLCRAWPHQTVWWRVRCLLKFSPTRITPRL